MRIKFLSILFVHCLWKDFFNRADLVFIMVDRHSAGNAQIKYFLEKITKRCRLVVHYNAVLVIVKERGEKHIEVLFLNRSARWKCDSQLSACEYSGGKQSHHSKALLSGSS